MVIMPEKPAAGKRIPSGWFSRLWNALYSAANITGDGRYIMVQQTPAGTSLVFNDRNLPAFTAAGGTKGGITEPYSGPLAVSIVKTSTSKQLYIERGTVNLNGELLYTSPNPLDVTSTTSGTHTVWLSVVDYGSVSVNLQLSIDLVDPDRHFNFLLASWDAETDKIRQIWNAPQICTFYAWEVTI